MADEPSAEQGPGQSPGRAAEARRYPDRERLSAAENEARFVELIRDREFAGTKPTANPTVIFTGGQPGSGKSHAKLQLGETFGPEGYVDVGTDSLRVYHPRWLELLAEDDVTAGNYTQLDAQAWVARCVEHAVSLQVNVMMDSTLSRQAEVNDFLAQFRAHGYRSEIAFVATPLAVSWMGNLDRYQGQYEAKGVGRISLRAPYENTAAQILDTVTNLEQQAAVDQISVYRRGGVLLYRNTRAPDRAGWTDPPRVRDAITTERSRAWTQPEAQAFIAQVTDLAARMEPQWRPDLVYAIDLAGNRAPTQTHQETLHALREQLDRGDPIVASSAEPDTDTPRIYSGGSAAARLAGLGFGESTQHAVERGTAQDAAPVRGDRASGPGRGLGHEDERGRDR